MPDKQDMVPDREWLELLVELRPRLIAKAAGQLRSAGLASAAAEDVVQQTVLIALQSEHQVRECTRLGWLSTVLANRVRDHIRKERRESGHLREVQAQSSGPSERRSKPDIGDLIRLLAGLDATERAIFHLLALGHTCEAIARHLGVNASVVRNRIYRVRKRMKGGE